MMAGRCSGDVCLICSSPFSTGNKAVGVTAGQKSLLTSSVERGDSELCDFLNSSPAVVYVHENCRRKYVKPLSELEKARKRTADADAELGSHKLTRAYTEAGCFSAPGGFQWREHCVLCGQKAVIDLKHPNRKVVHRVRTVEIKETLLHACMLRNDDWSHVVEGRLHTVADLHAADAVYHHNCYTAFTNGGCAPEARKSHGGRSADCGKMNIFDAMCEALLENGDGELYTLDELLNYMTSLTDDPTQVYSSVQLQHLLRERYGNNLFIADKYGRRNVVCFVNEAKRVINDKWYAEREHDMTKECERVVQTAAKLIKASIRETLFNTDDYPLTCTMRNRELAKEWVPPLLQLFLQTLICDEVKQIALGHCIVQGSRPRSAVSPVMFGVGVSLDYQTGKPAVVQLLSRLGLSVSPDEVNRFKQSVTQSADGNLPDGGTDVFTQWSADNVDHNIITLDGQGTFHGMGLISMSVRNSVADVVPYGGFSDKPIKRLPRVSVDKIVHGRTIPMHWYVVPNEPPLSKLMFKPVRELQYPYTLPQSIYLDVLWHAGWFFRGVDDPRPNWSGFMQDVVVGEHLPPADIRILPIIDVNPGDRSCMLSTLLFIQDQAKKLDIDTPCVTFDQPLWLKAVEIITSQSLNIVCRLGVFHLIMSFLGSIGKVMAGSGLAQALETCYGPNAVVHMLTGKAVDRALRGHYLVESALYSLLLHSLLLEQEATDQDMQALRSLYDYTCENKFNVTSVVIDECLVKLKASLNTFTDVLASQSRTAKLWVQYLSYIQTVKTLIRAERTGDWNLHLVTVQQMLNLFAATGHNNYAKCGRLYLQMMLDLPEKHSGLHMKLSCGHHSVRRSDRLWSGLSTDLLIEQVMMKTIKGQGGLTHGRGMTEGVRCLWVHSLHECASVHAAINDLVGIDLSAGSDYHDDLGKSRRSRDFQDLNKILEFFAINNPFEVQDGRLHNIATGLVASDTDGINCDSADDVGLQIMQSMDGKAFTDVVLRRTQQVVTMSRLNMRVKINGTDTAIDPHILFTRLVLIMQTCGDIERCFEYELTPMPTALYKDGRLRKTDKSQLTKELMKDVHSSTDIAFHGVHVIDGGYLLHRVKWNASNTYQQVCEQYGDFVKAHYGNNCIVVFDGYGNCPSIKDHEHSRRAVGRAPDCTVEPNKVAYRNPSTFLLNMQNKQCFVHMLKEHLETQCGHVVYQARDDADTVVVQHALSVASSGLPVKVVANDTDIVVCLVHHYKPTMADIFVVSESARVRSARSTVIPVHSIVAKIGKTAAEQLLAVHSISGCDTTSALFGHSKGSVYKKVVSCSDTLPLTRILSSSSSSQEDVVDAGLRLMTLIYDGHGQKLNHLRFLTYNRLLSTRRPTPERLPPTERAAKFHLLRAHLQIVVWEMLNTDCLQAVDWGWMLKDGAYVPIDTDLPPGPQELMKVIHCQCNPSADNPCGSQRCTCRRHGIPCLAGCLHCFGEKCTNCGHQRPLEPDINVNCNDEDTCSELCDDDGLNAVSELYEDVWLDEEVVETT